MVGKDFSITHITFKKGAVRGNHFHRLTTQTDIILSGRLVDECREDWIRGEVREINPGEEHAYKASRDSEMISICFGKRIGSNYSKDTYALQEPLIKG